MADANALTTTPTPAPNQPPQKQGFGAILKNKILPMVGPITARLGALYGNPQGLMDEQTQYERRMQQPDYQLKQEQVNEIPEHLKILQNQAKMSDPDVALGYKRKELGMERELTPATGMVDGNLTEGSFTPKTDGSPGLDYIPASVKGASPQPAKPFDPSMIGKLPPFAGSTEVPTPIGTAAAQSSTVGAPVKGVAGKTTMDAEGNYIQPFHNPYTGEVMYSQKVLPPVGMMPPRMLIPYLPSGKTPMNADQQDWATAAQAYNTRTSQSERIDLQTGADGNVYAIPVQSGTTTGRGTPPSLEGMPAPIAGAIAPKTSTPNVGGPQAVTPGNAGQGAPAKAPTMPKPVASAGAPKAVGVQKAVGPVQKLYDDYQAAIGRQRTMHKNFEDAMNSGGKNQQAMLSLLANHLGMTAGLQKGARLNQAMWSEAERSTGWWDKTMSRYFSVDPKTGDHILEDPQLLGGVVLAPEQMKQMVDLADQMADTKYNQWQAEIRGAKTGYGMSGDPLKLPGATNSTTTPPSPQIHFTPIH